MATWHQNRNAGGMRALYAPHESGWKVVSNPVGALASAIVFREESAAIAYQKRCGGIVIAPDGLGLWRAVCLYKTPAGRNSRFEWIGRAKDARDARIKATVQCCANARRRVVRGIDGIETHIDRIKESE